MARVVFSCRYARADLMAHVGDPQFSECLPDVTQPALDDSEQRCNLDGDKTKSPRMMEGIGIGGFARYYILKEALSGKILR